MATIFIKVLIIFAMIAVGFAVCKARIITMEAEPFLLNGLLYIFTPCMILSSVATKELRGETITEAIHVMGGTFIYFIAMALLSLLFIKFMKHTPIEDLGVLMVTMTSVNSGFLGFPVTKSIFGDDMFFLMVCSNIILNFHLYCIAIFQLHYGSRSQGNFKDMFKAMKNPTFIVSCIAMVILFARIKIPAPAVDFFEMFGQATVPISMLLVGIRLANSDFKALLRNRDLILASVINVLVVPVMVFLVLMPLPLSNLVKGTLTFMSCFPAAAMQVAIAAKEGRNASLSAEAVALTTAFSMITIPLFATLISSVYGL